MIPLCEEEWVGDASNHQGWEERNDQPEPDWARVVATSNLVAVSHQLTKGYAIHQPEWPTPDPMFDRNIAALNELGVPWGPYYYPVLGTDRQANFDWFAARYEQAVAEHGEPAMRVMVDIEKDRGGQSWPQRAEETMWHLAQVEALVGHIPIVYASTSWLVPLNLPVDEVWQAHYLRNHKNIPVGCRWADEPPSDKPQWVLPKRNKRVLWQYTSQSRRHGIDANTIDANFSYDTSALWVVNRPSTGPGPTPPPAPVPVPPPATVGKDPSIIRNDAGTKILADTPAGRIFLSEEQNLGAWEFHALDPARALLAKAGYSVDDATIDLWGWHTPAAERFADLWFLEDD